MKREKNSGAVSADLFHMIFLKSVSAPLEIVLLFQTRFFEQ